MLKVFDEHILLFKLLVYLLIICVILLGNYIKPPHLKPFMNRRPRPNGPSESGLSMRRSAFQATSCSSAFTNDWLVVTFALDNSLSVFFFLLYQRLKCNTSAEREHFINV